MIFSSPSSNFQDEKLGDPLSRFVNKSLSEQHQCSEDMGVSKDRGTPKWMVYKRKPIRIDDVGVPLFLETPI